MDLHFIWSEKGTLPFAARKIRTTVFVDEQGFIDEFDDLDTQSLHVLLCIDGEPCGTARLFWEEQPRLMRLGRFALLQTVRGGGFGRAMLAECARKANELGAERLVLDAQKRAKKFYEACGFLAIGSEFMEENYPHYRMECGLLEKES